MIDPIAARLEHLPLRPYQLAGIAKTLARPDRRQIFGWDPGAGKSLAAIAMGEALKAKRILVVAPAMARGVWVHEFRKWLPDVEVHSVRWGPEVKLSRAESIERAAAYATRGVQICSYNLLPKLPAFKADLLIIDEAHHLRDPVSIQSKNVRVYAQAFPDMPALALTATPAPTEIRQIFNPVNTLFQDFFGLPTRAMTENENFLANYCRLEKGPYGQRYVGARPERMPILRRKMEPILHRVTEADFAQYLPPIQPQMLWIEDGAATELSVAQDWIREQVAADRHHIAVVCYRHATLHAVAEWAREYRMPHKVFAQHGKMQPHQRDNLRKAAQLEPYSLLCVTSESVRESVSLSWVKDALVLEWRTTPAQALQLIGRFARADSATMAPTRVWYAAFPQDEARANLLEARMQVVADAFGETSKSAILREILAVPSINESQIADLFAESFGFFRERRAIDWDSLDA